jgi:tryptophan-rich sensory protein
MRHPICEISLFLRFSLAWLNVTDMYVFVFCLQMMMNVLWGPIIAGLLVPHGSAVTHLVLFAVNENVVMARKSCSTMVNVNPSSVLLVMKQARKASVLVSHLITCSYLQ